MKTLSQTVNGNTVVVTAEWSDGVSAAAGVSRYLVTGTTTVKDGKIARSEFSYDRTDAQTQTYLAYVTAQGDGVPPSPETVPMTGAQAGNAGFTPFGDLTIIEITIAPGSPGVLQPATLDAGRCSTSGAPQLFPLASVRDGYSQTFVSVSLDEFRAEERSIVVEAGSSTSSSRVSCGQVEAAVAAPAPAPQPAAPPPAPAPQPAPVIAPNTGSGPQGRARPAMMTLLLVVACIGIATTALGVRLGHVRR